MKSKLKKKEIAKFKKILEEMRDEMTRSLRGAPEKVKVADDAKGYSQHQADEGTDDFIRTISMELTSQELVTLQHIDRALEKIEENSYGICDVTGEAIPIARLEAIPYATVTVAAQEKMEKGLI